MNDVMDLWAIEERLIDIRIRIQKVMERIAKPVG